MVINGWIILLHRGFTNQVRLLVRASNRAQPKGLRTNANVKLLAALGKLVLETIPGDPSRAEHRQGNTLGAAYRHWFRAKFFGRFRLFFRYDSRARVIVFAWVNDERTLRQQGGRNDPYTIFRSMLASGNPPNEWASLVADSSPPPEDLTASLAAATKAKD